jgi:small ligand-binding sensory domain FIST
VPFAAALSEHPITATAVGEVAGQVLEQLSAACPPDRGPDLALLFVTPHHGGALEDAAAAVRSTLRPGTLLGSAAVAVAGNGREVEDGPGVSLWAGCFEPVVPVRLEAHPGPEGPTVSGLPDQLPFVPQALVLLADPFSFPADALFALLADRHPGLPVVGGMASAARGPGGNRLALDGDVVTSGAVGAFVGPGVRLTTVVSQGCRPIGQPLVVTNAERSVIKELAGQPPLERLVEQAKALPERDVRLINRGLHMGKVIDEHKLEFGRGDFLIRNVLGADQSTGAMQIGDEMEVGATVQFQVRDAESADEDLRSLLDGHAADGALLFTCNGRGTNLFPGPDHDASVLADLLGSPPAAGFFAAGELGPVGGRNFLHGFTASVLLFQD